jgi:hypothetical protein
MLEKPKKVCGRIRSRYRRGSGGKWNSQQLQQITRIRSTILTDFSRKENKCPMPGPRFPNQSLMGDARRALIVGACMLALQACLPLDQHAVFDYSPHAAPPVTVVRARLGVSSFHDLRPDEDRESTESLGSIEEMIAVKVAEDLGSSGLFAGVDYPAKLERDTFLLKGEILRFSWDWSCSSAWWIVIPIPFPPGAVGGCSVKKREGHAKFHVRMIHWPTGRILVDYTKESDTVMHQLDIFYDRGEELGMAFRNVMSFIKEAMIEDAPAWP